MFNPSYILVNCVDATQHDKVLGNGRSVAFPVAKTKNGKTLFATCSHTVTDHIGKGLQLYMTYADGTQLILDSRFRNHVIHPDQNSDLSFLEIHAEHGLSMVKFGDRHISPGTELTHVRNVSSRAEFEGQFAVLTTQNAGEHTGKYLVGRERFHQLDADLIRTLGNTPKCPHRGIAMRSWPGVSGSPLWDKFGNVLGMVAGGTEELTSASPNYNLVFLPSKEIRMCLKIYLGHLIV
jgi:hypothetical protein